MYGTSIEYSVCKIRFPHGNFFLTIWNNDETILQDFIEWGLRNGYLAPNKQREDNRVGNGRKSCQIINDGQCQPFFAKFSETSQEPEAPKRTKIYTVVQEAAHGENLRYERCTVLYTSVELPTRFFEHFQNSANYEYITSSPPPSPTTHSHPSEYI